MRVKRTFSIAILTTAGVLSVACGPMPSQQTSGAGELNQYSEEPPLSGPIPLPGSSAFSADVSKAAKDRESDSIISWLNANGGWGNGRMQVDFSFNILETTPTTSFVGIDKHPAGYYSPDCSDGLKSFPIPSGGALEGEAGYSCKGNGDCHLLVVDRARNKLYESYRSNVVNGRLQSMCAIAWDLSKQYGATLRGDQCTSADAAGFPIAPLLFSADEIANGEIDHAIRFILPNDRMRKGFFVRPATHAGAPSGPSQAVPYGARFRLKSSFDLSTLKPSAQVVAKAMQKYGMLLADGGNIALTAVSDRYTKHKWSEVGFGPRDLASLKVTDFEMVEAGSRIPLTYNCVRNP